MSVEDSKPRDGKIEEEFSQDQNFEEVFREFKEYESDIAKDTSMKAYHDKYKQLLRALERF
jgi:hypothetical protein